MRHQNRTKRLGRTTSPRKSLIRGIATSVILYEDIETTREKAKVVRSIIDRLITKAKKSDTLKATRYLKKYLFDKNASKKVIEDLTKRFKDRPSGFTRFINSRIRKGDNAQLVKFQLLKD